MIILDARRVPGINRAFAIAAKETTVEQFLRFDPSHWYNREITADRTCPVNVVTWARAIDYCEWLDGREGLPARAVVLPAAGGSARPPPGLPGPVEDRIPPAHAGRVGIRLPRRDHDPEVLRRRRRALIHRYAWVSTKDRQPTLMEPVGRLLPNDFGLFDVYGNVSEWNADIHRGRQPGRHLRRGVSLAAR